MEKNIYETKSVNTLIFTFSFPAILSLIVEIMTSVVDTIFAGHIGEASVHALTVMGLISPVLSIYTAFQSLYAVSTSILVARYLNNSRIRDGYLTTGILFTVIVSSIVSIISFLNMDTILHLLGLENENFLLAKGYLSIQLISNLFSAIGYTLTSCIRAFGYPKIEMTLTILSVAVNVIGNAIFAFGFNMGFVGLAFGTLASEIFCVLFSVLWMGKNKLLPVFNNLFNISIFSKACELFCIGFAQTIIQVLSGCTGFFLNNSLLIYTTANHVAVWNIIQKLYTLLLMPIVGITQGVQTVIAYYSGHKYETKVQKTIKLTIAYTVLYGILASVSIFIFGEKILKIFGTSDVVFSIGMTVIKIVFLTFPVVGIFYTILTLFEVTGHEIKAVALSLIRQVFLMLPLVYLLPYLFKDTDYSVFLSIPISDVIVLLIAIGMQRKKENKIYKKHNNQLNVK